LPVPTLAEINDIYNTLYDGADCLVLAAETAVGKFPVPCVEMVMSVISEFEIGREEEETAAASAARQENSLKS
jgi:pyruvate kinase